MIAGIVISSATYAMDKPYSYRVPEGMLLAPGQRVTVPFGRGNIRTEGIVLSLTEGDETNLKCVEKPLEDAPLLTEYQLRMAAFLRERYFCTFYDAVRAILPPNFWFQEKQTVSLTEDTGWKIAAIRKEGALAMLKAIEAMGKMQCVQSFRPLPGGREAEGNPFLPGSQKVGSGREGIPAKGRRKNRTHCPFGSARGRSDGLCRNPAQKRPGSETGSGTDGWGGQRQR